MSQTIIIRGAASLSDALAKLAGLPLDRPWALTVERLDRKRSLQQNARLWAILTHVSDQVADEEGKKYSPETWMSFFKSKFLGKRAISVDGELHLVEKRSSTLKTVEFGEFMTQIEVWSIDHGVNFYDSIRDKEGARNTRCA